MEIETGFQDMHVQANKYSISGWQINDATQ